MTNENNELDVTPENAAEVVGLLDFDWREQHKALVSKVDKSRLLKLVRNCDQCRVWVHGFGCDVIVQKGSVQSAIQAAADDAIFVVLFNGVDLLIGGRVYAAGPGGDEIEG